MHGHQELGGPCWEEKSGLIVSLCLQARTIHCVRYHVLIQKGTVYTNMFGVSKTRNLNRGTPLVQHFTLCECIVSECSNHITSHWSVDISKSDYTIPLCSDEIVCKREYIYCQTLHYTAFLWQQKLQTTNLHGNKVVCMVYMYVVCTMYVIRIWVWCFRWLLLMFNQQKGPPHS